MDPELTKTYMTGAEDTKGSFSESKQDISTGTSSVANHGSLADVAVLEHSDEREGVAVQELSPVDHGFGAWAFCACSFVVETLIWGFLFRYALFLSLISYGH